MPLHKINRHEIFDDLVDTNKSISEKIIRRMVVAISKYDISKCTGSMFPRLFINVLFVDDLFSISQFIPPPIRDLNKSNIENGHTLTIVGKLGGVDVYVSEILDEHEIFIGQSEREIQKFKRNKKITKILDRC